MEFAEGEDLHHARAAACRDPFRQEAASGWFRSSWARGSPKSARSKRGANRKSATIAGGCNSSCARPRRRAVAAQSRGGGQRGSASNRALELIAQLFSSTAKAPFAPEELPAKLEQTIGLGRNSWPLDAIRQLADVFLEVRRRAQEEPRRSKSRWLNLCGFCLRPGLRISRRRFPHRAGAARSTPRACSSPTRCSTKSIGGSSGAASPAD